MTAATFDMFDFAAELIESGVPEKQANAYAKTLGKVQRNTEEKVTEAIIEKVKNDYRLDDMAHKRDIRELELSIELVRRDIKELDLTIQSRFKDVDTKIETVKTAIEKSRTDLIMWFLGTAFTMAGFIFMLIRLKFLIVPD
jgi:Flp pilus assembly protein TadB